MLKASTLGELYLAGFENDKSKSSFNFILNNGQISKTWCDNPERVMLPEGQAIRKVQFWSNPLTTLEGFKCFDSDNKLICQVGSFTQNLRTVNILENEIIVGVTSYIN